MEQTQLQKLASQANGETWKYLTKGSLGLDEKVQMLSCAYASLYMWAQAGGTSLHFARAHWLISRVCCVLENLVLASQHSKLCRAYTDQAEARKDFDLVYAVESEARVAALARDLELAKELKTKAHQMASTVQDPEDRQIVEGDLSSGPWFGLDVK